MRQRNSAVFLDRDGVINRTVYYEELGIVDSPFHPDQFILNYGVKKAIALIHRMGKMAILVSNQPGVAKGYYSKKSFDSLNKKMKSILNYDSALDGIYYCLHHPQGVIKKYRKVCSCRKPKVGLFLKASREQDIDLRRSYMVGDGVLDIEAGKRAGCRTILIGQSKCDMCRILLNKGLKPDTIAENLLEAVNKIKKWEG